MAKLTAPLFSFSASGAIAKSLVYFGWKGLNVARKYVIPANPKSDAQVIQRGYLQTAVAEIHVAMGHLTKPITSADKSAYSLLGSLKATPRTWFNTITKEIIDRLGDSLGWMIFTQGTVTAGVDQLTFSAQNPTYGGDIATTGSIYYGTSKTAMLSSIVCTIAEMIAGKIIPNLTTGTKYYLKYVCSAPAGQVGAQSGIYFGTPT